MNIDYSAVMVKTEKDGSELWFNSEKGLFKVHNDVDVLSDHIEMEDEMIKTVEEFFEKELYL